MKLYTRDTKIPAKCYCKESKFTKMDRKYICVKCGVVFLEDWVTARKNEKRNLCLHEN